MGNEHPSLYAVTCDENAEYEEGQCVCRENYTGDGIVCRRLAGEYIPNCNYGYIYQSLSGMCRKFLTCVQISGKMSDTTCLCAGRI